MWRRESLLNGPRWSHSVAKHAYTALVAVQVLYGLLPAAGKTVFSELDPLAMTSIRVLGATFLLAWVHVLGKGAWPAWRLWPGIGRLAFFGIVVNMGLFSLGLQWTHPVNATLLITTIPVFTYLIAVVTGREGVGPRRLAGILLALSGAVYLIGLSGLEASPQNALGDVLVLINALSFSYFLVISKRWAEEHDILSLNVWMFVAASVVFVPIAVLTGTPGQAVLASPSTLAWMAFIILGPTVGAYILNATALRQVPSSTVAVFIYLQPPVSAVAAWVVLRESLDWRIGPAALLILAGVWLVARRRPQVLEGRGEVVRA